MKIDLITFLLLDMSLILILFGSFKFFRDAFFYNLLFLVIGLIIIWSLSLDTLLLLRFLIFTMIPMGMVNSLFFVFFQKDKFNLPSEKYRVNFQLKHGKLSIENMKRGVSIIGSAGSGKTESVIYNFLRHFSKHNFCGILHDYKDFELTEMAYPLFRDSSVKFHTISFDPIYARVNPIAPRYLPDEESVNEISKVLVENLLEIKDSNIGSSSKFFNDAVEGLVGGLIWKLKTKYPEYCTLPHLIAMYQYLNTETLISFLSSNITSKSMASAFINGADSERQTAAVKSTLSNAFKKISTQKIFMVLSADEVPLNINSPLNPGVISIVNNPKYETAYAPVIATIMHIVIKQMSVRNQCASFILMEEAPTIRLLNMHRVPATLRSYDITTIYVMQDKIQNDMLYGERASKAILSNLSYQFFGKVNDPDTAKYYERFFEIVKKKTTSINRGFNLNFDTRITKGEKEVSKIRASAFFRLKQGEFVSFADGKDKKVHFKLQRIKKEMPVLKNRYSEDDLSINFERIYKDVQSIFETGPN